MPLRYGNRPSSWQYRGSGQACARKIRARRGRALCRAYRRKGLEPGRAGHDRAACSMGRHLGAFARRLHHACKADENRTGA